MTKDLIKPSLVIFLMQSPENLLNNIKKRGRYFENKIEKEYLKKINQFTKLSFPLLVGVSRKSMVKKMVGDIENDIIQASVLLACLAVQNGAKILRVHDVKETFNAISVLQTV